MHSTAPTTWEMFSIQCVKMMAYSDSLTLKRAQSQDILLWNFRTQAEYKQVHR